MVIAKCLETILFLDDGFVRKYPIELPCPRIALTSSTVSALTGLCLAIRVGMRITWVFALFVSNNCDTLSNIILHVQGLLLEYKRVNGYCKVPRNHAVLGPWVMHQRSDRQARQNWLYLGCKWTRLEWELRQYMHCLLSLEWKSSNSLLHSTETAHGVPTQKRQLQSAYNPPSWTMDT